MGQIARKNKMVPIIESFVKDEINQNFMLFMPVMICGV